MPYRIYLVMHDGFKKLSYTILLINNKNLLKITAKPEKISLTKQNNNKMERQKLLNIQSI